MHQQITVKRTSAVIAAIGLILILALLIPMTRVMAASYVTKYLSRYATSYTGTISSPTSSFSITESVSWLSVSRSAYTSFKITATANTGDERRATVTVVNGSNVTYYTIIQNPGRFLVTFDANGGTGAPASQYKYYESDITLSSTIPTRAGYQFLGWAISSTATSPLYYAGGVYSSLNSGSLFAVWQRVSTITYYANGGTGAPASVTVPYGSYIGISTITPTRSGCTFMGWSTTQSVPNAGTVSYNPGYVFTLTSDLNLYAVWKTNHTLTYHANGGTGAPASKTTLYGYSFSISSTIPTWTNYEFLGWSTTQSLPNQGTVQYVAGSAYTITTNATLYAVWREYPTISYNANLGTGAPASISLIYGSTVGISSTTPTRSGCTFMGWSTTQSAANAGTVSYNPGYVFTLTSDLNLFAVWKTNHTLTYHANGGTGAPASFTTLYGNSFYISSTKPTWTNHEFLGWSTTQSLPNQGTVQYVAGNAYTITTNATLYAVWREYPTISYNANLGTGAPASISLIYGSTVGISSTTPTRSGCTFMGWSTTQSAANAGTVSYNPGYVFTLTSDLNLYAVWKTNHTLTYHANGGTGAPASKTTLYGYSFSISSTIPTWPNYEFLGWSTTQSLPNQGTVQYVAGNAYTITTNATLYAVWRKYPTITYNANAIDATGAPASVSVPSGSYVGISTIIPIRTGYNFLGWATSSTATAAGSWPTAFPLTEDIELFAVWIKTTYLITLDYNGLPGGATRTKTYDVGLPLPTLTQTHYEFLGWDPDEDATTPTYLIGDEYTANQRTTLYAIWQIKYYTLTYHTRGGINGPESVTIPAETYIAISSIEPTISGYLFRGWASDPFAEEPGSWPSAFPLTENLTLYALWKDNQSTVTFDPNGGTCDVTSIVYICGEPYETLPNATRKEGELEYTFVGWYTSSDISEGIEVTIDSLAPNEDLTLYARWAYTITYNAYAYEGYGGYGGWEIWENEYLVGENGDVTDIIPPRGEGFTFLGWTKDKDRAIVVNAPVPATYIQYITGDEITTHNPVTLYGVWSLDTSGWSDDDYIDDLFCIPVIGAYFIGESREYIQNMPTDYRKVYINALRDYRNLPIDGTRYRNVLLFLVGGSGGACGDAYIKWGTAYIQGTLFHEWGHMVDMYSNGAGNFWSDECANGNLYELIESDVERIIRNKVTEKYDELSLLEPEPITGFVTREIAIENIVRCFMYKHWSEEFNTIWWPLSSFESEVFIATRDELNSIILAPGVNGAVQVAYGIVTNNCVGDKSSYDGEYPDIFDEVEKEQIKKELFANVLSHYAMYSQSDIDEMEIYLRDSVVAVKLTISEKATALG